MTKIQPLTHSELLSERTYRPGILLPGEIPLHAAVFNSDFAYTPEFVEEVRKEVPKSIEEDVSEIEKKLGQDLGLKVTETGIYIVNQNYECRFKDFSHRTDPEGKLVNVGIGHMSIAMDHKGGMKAVVGLDSFRHHPMDTDKLKQYSFEEKGNDRVAVWRAHNIHDQVKSWQIYLRNFAIMFNNLGLRKME